MTPEIVELVRDAAGLPLHTILLIAIIALWRRVNVLQEKLDDCLAKDS
jgi:hypothetical protein